MGNRPIELAYHSIYQSERVQIKQNIKSQMLCGMIGLINTCTHGLQIGPNHAVKCETRVFVRMRHN